MEEYFESKEELTTSSFGLKRISSSLLSSDSVVEFGFFDISSKVLEESFSIYSLLEILTSSILCTLITSSTSSLLNIKYEFLLL